MFFFPVPANKIYSNKLGYLGGISWTLWLVRTAQLYPNADVSMLVEKFFVVASKWNFSDPVDINFPIWKPKPEEASQPLKIVSPIVPKYNTTFNVTKSNCKIIKEQLNKAFITMAGISLGKRKYEDLFKPAPFFAKYKHFIALLVTSANQENHLAWNSLVESRIRVLIGSLDAIEVIEHAQVNTKCFERRTDNGEICSMWFIGLRFTSKQINLDLTQDLLVFKNNVTDLAVS